MAQRGRDCRAVARIHVDLPIDLGVVKMRRMKWSWPLGCVLSLALVAPALAAPQVVEIPPRRESSPLIERELTLARFGGVRGPLGQVILDDALAPRAESAPAVQRLTPPTTGEGGVADQLGSSMAFDGTHLLVGAMQDLVTRDSSLFGERSGSVFCYRAQGGGFVKDGKLVPPESAQRALFGFSIALDNGLAVVGAPRAWLGEVADVGLVYLYSRASGQWQLQQILQAPDGIGGDFFGWSVAVKGDRLIVGAPFNDPGEVLDAGAAYVFARGPDNLWYFNQKLTEAQRHVGDQLGSAVAVSGEVALVGVPNRIDDGGTRIAGRVLVFTRTSAWLLNTIWQPKTLSDRAGFGTTLLLSDTHAFVGAPGDGPPEMPGRGAVYAYPRLTGTQFDAPTILQAPDAAARDGLGNALSFDGATLLVGAQGRERIIGAAYAFAREGAGFGAGRLLRYADDGLPANHGSSVAVLGNLAWVGANLDNVGNDRAQGTVQRFTFDGNAWTRIDQIDEGEGAAEELFGLTLDVDGDTLAVGAPNDDPTLVLEDGGSVSMFERRDGDWQRVAYLTAPDGLDQDLFGMALDLRKDWLAVGTPRAVINGSLDRGAVYLFRRVAGQWTFAQKLVRVGGVRLDLFGFGVAFDENATRLIVGVPGADQGGSDGGAAELYELRNGQWQPTQTLFSPKRLVNGAAGLRVALSSQIAVVGSPDADYVCGNCGTVYVFANGGGSYQYSTGWDPPQATRSVGEFFGNSLAVDGRALVIGAPGASGERFYLAHGAAYYLADATDTRSELRRFLPDQPADDLNFGAGVALFDDVMLIGAPRVNGASGPMEGRVYRYVIDGRSIEREALLSPTPAEAYAFLGRLVAFDGSTVVAGAPGRRSDNPREGAVYIYPEASPRFRDDFE